MTNVTQNYENWTFLLKNTTVYKHFKSNNFLLLIQEILLGMVKVYKDFTAVNENVKLMLLCIYSTTDIDRIHFFLQS